MGKTIRRLAALMLICLILAGSCLAAGPRVLVPVGEAVGLRLNAKGIVIAGFEEEQPSPAQKAGLKKGDVILSVNGQEVNDLQALGEVLKQGGRMNLKVQRGEQSLRFQVMPRMDGDTYRLGCFVRDGISGIGTVTFYDPETGCFGALGHGVSDPQTHEPLPIRDGSVVDTQVTEVQRGCTGTPGALRGSFDGEKTLGSIEKNTGCGLFGVLDYTPDGQALPVADPSEVRLGAATIRSNVRGDEVRDYAVQIEQVEQEGASDGRNLLLRVIDPVLLEQTGGIVQGMSGSPIIQDGKLVGAVTHVLVNQPDTGYGIFIENMLEAAG